MTIMIKYIRNEVLKLIYICSWLRAERVMLQNYRIMSRPHAHAIRETRYGWSACVFGGSIEILISF